MSPALHYFYKQRFAFSELVAGPGAADLEAQQYSVMHPDS
jgi:hypothetical protein